MKAHYYFLLLPVYIFIVGKHIVQIKKLRIEEIRNSFSVLDTENSLLFLPTSAKM